MNFEPLRDMESFTEDMFNRIIAFQTKEHPAWDTQRPFSERIAGLALHDLIFSHPQRDPTRFGPSITHFYPRREELRRIAAYARAVAEHPVVLDAHARNGFIGSLLAREGVRVIGLRDTVAKPNQIAEFYDSGRYELRPGTLLDANFNFDVAFSAWMPAGCNDTPALLAHRPHLLVQIFTGHIDVSTGVRQTGTDAAFRDIPQSYRLIDEWSENRPADVLREIWPEITGNIEETRITRVYAGEPFHGLKRPAPETPVAPYDWENDLNMALLAREAKKFLRARGMQVE